MKTSWKHASIAVGVSALLMAFPFSTTHANVSAQTSTFAIGDLKMANGSVNSDGEPQIRADKDGNFYIASERGLGGGTDVWKSTDSGRTYQYLGQPNALSQSANPGFAPGGGDTDVAVAPVKNANGFYNTYVTSLSLANVDVSTSEDGGKTWSTNYASATVPGDDREWIAADGANTVYISYHDVVTTNINVNRSDDGGKTFTQIGQAINPASNPGVVGASNNNWLGNITVDHNTGTVYQVFVAANGATENSNSVNTHVVYMAVSHDGGKSFSDYTVHNGPTSVSYGHQFPNVSVDEAGNVYAIYSDDHNIYYSCSTDQGKTWSTDKQINSSPSTVSVMPWSTTGSAGKLGVVWYGAQGTDASGPNAANNEWHVYYTYIGGANTNTPTLDQTQATGIVHKGGVCEGGITCQNNSTENRDLYDDFGVDVNPLTGFVSIAYDNDQPSNSSSNLRTQFATQTAGPSLK